MKADWIEGINYKFQPHRIVVGFRLADMSDRWNTVVPWLEYQNSDVFAEVLQRPFGSSHLPDHGLELDGIKSEDSLLHTSPWP